MDTYHVQTAIAVFGFRVETFPAGVKEAFGSLMKMTDAYKRTYYGLSEIDGENKVLYWATAEEKNPGEAEKYHCERYTIPAGDYLSVTLCDWLKQTECIKDLFHEMMQDSRADCTKQCIEWYKNDDEMVCLLQMK